MNKSNATREIYCLNTYFAKKMKPQITELIFFHLSEQKNKPKVINKRKTVKIGEEINKIGNKDIIKFIDKSKLIL